MLGGMKVQEIIIRPVKEDELYRLWELSLKEDYPEWKKWDAPFEPYTSMTYEQFIQKKDYFMNQEDFWGIYVNDDLVGSLCYYWEHEASLWLEMGILIYDPMFWNSGIGTKALKMWIDHLFHEMPLIRVGFTTWSGNERMVKVGEKLGMTMEARMRKCRLHNGVYYDSIRMGLLREEWEEQNESFT
ncbi:N-acetyltransferase [Psychrobacillus sp. AK 1817]|uniref:GNAT family N-acetyltransferase n=2 Tax=Bacillaceae TaxID=186817 RepID=A0ABR8RCR7_9BACI|nr:GNAT family N-acetyltransferase [Psychrobacillus faecigallinarum]QEY23057.1 N-acetyltransferase [Psychrobacillus sp. AK 1817]QGM32502.1 GNAT family N-acetyltransferase [Bacillus sp. N3536]